MLVNHKRVARIMREDNLLAVQPRAFVVTTDSHHQLEVYLNLASRMKLTGINQLWVADITYIRLHREFVYLAVILDSFSRKVVGWELDRTLATRLPMAALECAIAERKPPPGLVHHSDRGVQYASGDYVTVLRKHQMIPSMSRPANPYDNASCESFLKTLKREEIHANEYRDLDHLRANIEEFHRALLQSSAGCTRPWAIGRRRSSSKPPTETPSTGASMSFFRHAEIFRSDVVVDPTKLGRGTASRWSVPRPSSRTRPKERARLIVSMSLRPAIPRRVGLHQSPPPLHRPTIILKKEELFE